MIIRLAGMYSLSLYFIWSDSVTSGTVGAIIFAAGMLIEAAVSYLEGRKIVQHMPEQIEEHHIKTKGQVFYFYKPLLLSSLVAMFIGPIINIMLGKTEGIALAISSFAIAGSIMQLMLSFFTYIHQIVLNFYTEYPKKVNQFALTMGFIPFLLTLTVAYTPLGPWFLEHAMNVHGELLEESLRTLQAFILFTLITPFLDYSNGLILLRGQTKTMFRSQTANAICTTIVLVILVLASPGLNGVIGAVAQSTGLLAELLIVWMVIRKTNREPSLQSKSSSNKSIDA